MLCQLEIVLGMLVVDHPAERDRCLDTVRSEVQQYLAGDVGVRPC